MLSKIKLIISEKSKVIETVIKETSTESTHMIKSLEEFQLMANTTLTKMIEKHGENGDQDCEDEDKSEDDENEDDPISPKKIKKISN